jgi:hypothetical protein
MQVGSTEPTIKSDGTGVPPYSLVMVHDTRFYPENQSGWEKGIVPERDCLREAAEIGGLFVRLLHGLLIFFA